MSWNVFIDGEAGTTGLQIRDRLQNRTEIALLQLDNENRKNLQARLAAYKEADVAILCLPDSEVKKIIPLVQDFGVRIIDASTTHRTDPDWVFGYPELSLEVRQRVESSRFVSNPGCYSTGSIAILAPLVKAGLIAPDAHLSINAVSGYSGGGNALIREFTEKPPSQFFVYGTAQDHKHIPEIVYHCGLTRRPIFSPSVGAFRQGMLVQIPLSIRDAGTANDYRAVLANHYKNSQFVFVLEDENPTRIDPQRLNGTNRMELLVCGDQDSGNLIIYALLDNLGKGASGAAVQNLNLMLGLPEETGL